MSNFLADGGSGALEKAAEEAELGLSGKVEHRNSDGETQKDKPDYCKLCPTKLPIERLHKNVETMPLPFRLKGGRPRRSVDAKRVIALRARGLSWRAIAKKLRVGTGTAFRAAKGCSKTVSK